MSVMLYKSGRGTKVWGKELQSKVVVDGDVEELLADGWYEHPGDVNSSDTEQKPIKRTRKTKAESDESDD
ncbi:MAG TPA: hypothetical protein DDY48_12215 [Erwinia persicina]|nr:hypothetical protein [Erwinia persicina]